MRGTGSRNSAGFSAGCAGDSPDIEEFGGTARVPAAQETESHWKESCVVERQVQGEKREEGELDSLKGGRKSNEAEAKITSQTAGHAGL